MVEVRNTTHRALASRSRVEILHLLRQHGGFVAVDDVARQMGLHVNTVREHLDTLVRGGLVARQPEVRTTRGRPRMLYEVTELGWASSDRQAREDLAGVLVQGFGRFMENPSASAEEAGRHWAERLDLPDLELPDDDGASQLDVLLTHLTGLGFSPERPATGGDPRAPVVHLRRCPLADLAGTRPDVVCSVHLGLTRGILARVEGPLEVERLEPTLGSGSASGPEPGYCVLHLRVRAA